MVELQADPWTKMNKHFEELLEQFQVPSAAEIEQNHRDRYNAIKTKISEYKEVKREKRALEKENKIRRDKLEELASKQELITHKISKYEKLIENNEKQAQKILNTIDTGVELWNMVGLRIEAADRPIKDVVDEIKAGRLEGTYSLHFSKLDGNDKTYTVKVTFDHDGKVKIFETKPRNIVTVKDLTQIEDSVNQYNKFQFRALLVQLRNKIKQNISKV